MAGGVLETSMVLVGPTCDPMSWAELDALIAAKVSVSPETDRAYHPARDGGAEPRYLSAGPSFACTRN
jgi:hypothetical protein